MCAFDAIRSASTLCRAGIEWQKPTGEWTKYSWNLNNPFAELSLVLPAVSMQVFVVLMVLLIIVGTGLDMLHKKNVVYFFRNAKKAKKSAKTELSTGKKTAVILKTVAQDIATTSELGMGKRRLAHVLGM